MILFHFEITTLSSIWYLEQFSLRTFFVRLGINLVRKRFFAPFVPFFTHVSTPTTTRITTATTKLLLGPLSRARGRKILPNWPSICIFSLYFSDGILPSTRGIGVFFGPDVTKKFLGNPMRKEKFSISSFAVTMIF